MGSLACPGLNQSGHWGGTASSAGKRSGGARAPRPYHLQRTVRKDTVAFDVRAEALEDATTSSLLAPVDLRPARRRHVGHDVVEGPGDIGQRRAARLA